MPRHRSRPPRTPPPPSGDEPIVHTIEGAAARALDALDDAARLLHGLHTAYVRASAESAEESAGLRRGARALDDLPDAPLDAIAAPLPYTAPLIEPLRSAGRAFVEWAAATDDDATVRLASDVNAAAARLAEAVAAARADIPGELPQVPRTQRHAYAGQMASRVAAFVREQGLEHASAEVMLGTTGAGTRVSLVAPLPPATAHVSLTEYLYQRLQLALADETLPMLECLAARWRFACWGGHPSVRVKGDEFGRSVREHEYVFVERPLLAADATLMELLPEQEWFETMPPRQRAMALALAGSIAGAFTVVAREGAVSVLEDAITGRRHRVHEHNPEIRYRTGDVALGRLLPWVSPTAGDDFAWLRSPGMAFLSAEPGYAQVVAETLATMEMQLPPGLAREAFIASALASRVPQLPLPVPPARSAEEAELLRVMLYELLEEAGLVRRTRKKADLPAELRSQVRGIDARRLGTIELDADLAEWLVALQMQGDPGRPPAGGGGRRDLM